MRARSASTGLFRLRNTRSFLPAIELRVYNRDKLVKQGLRAIFFVKLASIAVERRRSSRKIHRMSSIAGFKTCLKKVKQTIRGHP